MNFDWALFASIFIDQLNTHTIETMRKTNFSIDRKDVMQMNIFQFLINSTSCHKKLKDFHLSNEKLTHGKIIYSIFFSASFTNKNEQIIHFLLSFWCLHPHFLFWAAICTIFHLTFLTICLYTFSPLSITSIFFLSPFVCDKHHLHLIISLLFCWLFFFSMTFLSFYWNCFE